MERATPQLVDFFLLLLLRGKGESTVHRALKIGLQRKLVGSCKLAGRLVNKLTQNRISGHLSGSFDSAHSVQGQGAVLVAYFNSELYEKAIRPLSVTGDRLFKVYTLPERRTTGATSYTHSILFHPIPRRELERPGIKDSIPACQQASKTENTRCEAALAVKKEISPKFSVQAPGEIPHNIL
ncbi:hypothetical protein M569_00263 [Genlisea aurea]|uniref:Uncharacterized protein n=1 Tax=Genlisea aurea TaxID=192259 RepID=S8ENP7_9LAMI|nr:hypothetical protein M569_00263 [Genlisea aurea]